MNQDFSKLEKEANFVLGEKVGTPEQYAPEILVRIPRSENREKYSIDAITFTGKDVWHCFECYVGTYKGAYFFPLTIEYSSDSKYIVESKSLKLYLNSFNNETKIHRTKAEVIRTIKWDLTRLLTTNVSVYETVDLKERKSPFYLNEKNPAINNDVRVIFEGFRSKCKVTNQPDFAAVWIDIKDCKSGYKFDNWEIRTEKEVTEFLVSMRDENHFHEECCELIFDTLLKKYTPRDLTVVMNFTRRGGISICPVRSTTFDYKTYMWHNE